MLIGSEYQILLHFCVHSCVGLSYVCYCVSSFTFRIARGSWKMILEVKSAVGLLHCHDNLK